jgi:hypothetical protein
MRATSSGARFGTTGCIIVPASLFIALMISTAGIAVYPRVAAAGAALICSGEVVYESHGASYRPGEYIVTREIYCQSGVGKDARRDEIILQAAGVSFLLYAVIVFLLLRFLVAPWMRRRVGRALPGAGMRSPAGPDEAAAPADLRSILAQVSEAVARGAPRVTVRNVSVDASGAGEERGAVAERLARLKQLRDEGLITAGDYEAKKAEILSGL